MRTVSHILLTDKGRVVSREQLPPGFLETATQQALKQAGNIQRYAQTIGEQRIFYVIHRVNMRGRSGYLLSYMWDSYRREMVRILFQRLVLYILPAMLLIWIPSLWLAKYLSRPLVSMEKHVKRIAEKDWYEPVRLDRKDEIGQLARSIESMRKQLIRKDEAQQALLQNVSHDLKTPVMVIRSYAQSIGDGIFPKGDLPATIKVIDEESARLEKRIANLLYLTKLEYLSSRKPVREPIDLKEKVETTVDRLRLRRPELEWSFNLIPAEIKGDPEQWDVALENLYTNQLRYAAKQIGTSISRQSQDGKSYYIMRIWNDGPPIEQKVINNLFREFQKGSQGEFGLGLVIVHRIISLHRAEIWAENEDGGVSFYIRIPADD